MIEVTTTRVQLTPLEELVPPELLAHMKRERAEMIDLFGEDAVLAWERKIDEVFLFGDGG